METCAGTRCGILKALIITSFEVKAQKLQVLESVKVLCPFTCYIKSILPKKKGTLERIENADISANENNETAFNSRFFFSNDFFSRR